MTATSRTPAGGAPARAHRVEAVVFDLFGTLTDGRLELRRTEMTAALGAVLGAPPDAFAAAMRASFDERAVGALGGVADTLTALCGRLDVDPTPAALTAAVALRHAHIRELATPRPGALAVLARLRARGLGVAVVTDCSAETPADWADLPYAPLVDHAVFSCEIGRRKPHPSLYRAAAAGLGVEPAGCLYVGDGGSGELSGARAVGMAPVRLAPPHEDWGPDVRYDAEVDWDGPVIGGLDEVPALAGVAP